MKTNTLKFHSGLAVSGTSAAGASGVAAATAGAAVEGAITGAVAGVTSSAANNAIARGSNWWKFNRSFLRDLESGFWGGLGGAVLGGAIGAARYGFSDAYQWQTHKNVSEYANSKGTEYNLYEAARYVNAIEGGDAMTSFWPGEEGVGMSSYNYGNDFISIDQNDFMINGEFHADRFYSTMAHEIKHENLFSVQSPDDWVLMKSFNKKGYTEALGTQEKLINQQMIRHRYFNNWDISVREKIQSNYSLYKNFSHTFYLSY